MKHLKVLLSVTFLSTQKDVSINMELTKVEHRVIPVSIFEIPAGYKASND